MKLVEHIRHGDYENYNSVSITGELTLEDVGQLLDRSPYYFSWRRNSYWKNVNREIFESLIKNERAQFGWADYYLEDN